MRYWTATLVLLFCVASSFAADLADYSRRIGVAALIAQRLASEQAEGIAPERGVERIAQLVPEHEILEHGDGRLTTDNSSIHQQLATALSYQDPAKRSSALDVVAQQLKAIDESTRQMQDAASAPAAQTLDKQKLDDILQRPEYQRQRPPEESLFQRWRREFLEWLSRVFPDAPVAPEQGPAMGSIKIGLQVLILAAIIGLVGFMLYRFLPGLFGRAGARESRKRKQSRTILGEQIAPDDTPAGLFIEAERLAREGNFRAAIRRAYIAALCDLGDRRVVRLAKYKTNRDYLTETRKLGSSHASFAELTGLFERSWYGSRSSVPSDWEVVRELYGRTVTGASSST